MKTNAIIGVITTAIFLVTDISSCKKPDRVVDNGLWCSSGQSVLTIDDSGIPAAVKTKIYQPFSGSEIISTGNPNYNPTGRCVVIPFTFTDVPWNTAIDVNTIRNGYFGNGTRSFSDFFYENSWGQFRLTQVAIAPAPVNVASSVSAWGTSLSNEALFTQICQNAAIPWNTVDQNGDHNITQNEAQVIFTYSMGAGGACRPARITFNTNQGTYTIINRFAVIDCKRNDAADKAANPIAFNSTVCHELGHCLFGLPDRYGSTGICATGTTGPYDLMADNCSWKHFTIYDKMKIGWVTPRILEKVENRPGNARKCLAFPASETNPAGVVLWTAAAPDEFYIIENRYAAASVPGFESGFRQDGLAVWWASTNSDAIHLVSFKRFGQIPSTYRYDALSDHDSAMFIHQQGGSSITPYALKSNSGAINFIFRAISPAGSTMYAEL